MADDAMPAIIATIHSRDDMWITSRLAEYLRREGLMQSRMVGRFSRLRDLVGVHDDAPAGNALVPDEGIPAQDPWPFGVRR